jgi:hypothetical protein
MSILNVKDIASIDFDLEDGFVWANNSQANTNLFQACLQPRVDGKGYKKEIAYDDSGYLDGGCSAVNESLGYTDLQASYDVFIQSCRKAGFKIS